MTKAKPLPDQETLKRLLDYDPETGVLTWKARTPDMFLGKNPDRQCRIWNSRFACKPALSSSSNLGYLQGALFGQHCKAHRVIFKLMLGIEAEEVDHLNGDRKDNRWENLRAVSRDANQQNRALRLDNVTGHHGISETDAGTYRVTFGAEGAKKYIGTFESIDTAIAVRRALEDFWNFHKNHGRRTKD